MSKSSHSGFQYLHVCYLLSAQILMQQLALNNFIVSSIVVALNKVRV